jgi:hypothetical protein
LIDYGRSRCCDLFAGECNLAITRNLGCAPGRFPRHGDLPALGDPRTEYTCSSDYHLFSKGPKRILSFDGGGVRGAVSVAFLKAHLRAS